MPYTIYKSGGTSVTVPDNGLDVDYYNTSGGGGYNTSNQLQSGKGLGIQLVGRNTLGYGTAIAQNFLQLTENFASTNMPTDTTSLQGQLWFKQASASNGDLHVKISDNAGAGIANWRRIVVANSSGIIEIRGGNAPAVNPATDFTDGDIRVVGQVISMFAAGAWRQLFPAVYS